MRRLKENHAARLGSQGVETLPSFSLTRRQKSFETKSIAWQTTDRQSGGNGCGSGDAADSEPSRSSLAHELVTRIRQQGRTGITHERHTRALPQRLQQFARAAGLIVAMQGNQRLLQAQTRQQLPSVSRILGSDKIRCTQRLQRAGRQIPQIANGGRNDLEQTVDLFHEQITIMAELIEITPARRVELSRPAMNHPALHTLLRAAWWMSMVLILAACSSVPQALAPSAQRALDLANRGEHAAAAREYDALAAGRGTGADEYRLLATEQWLSASDPINAAISLRSIVGPLETTRLFARDLLAIEISMLQGTYAAAWQSLRALAAPKGDAQTERYHAVRQRIAIAIGEPVEAIRSSRQRESLARDSRQVAALRAELLTQLTAAVSAGARFDANLAGRDRIARGWLEAASLAAVSMGQSPELAAGTTAIWRRRYPGHPAAAMLARTHLNAQPEAAPARVSISQSVAATPATMDSDILRANAHVAAFLPLSGRHAALGTQIRDGLLAGFYRSEGQQRIPLRFYDTQREPLVELLRRAVNDGAVSIIGPLLKDDVTELARLRPAVPVLALNSLTNETPTTETRFLQFALSPEDEARAVAQRALAEGRTRAVVLAPNGDWGNRVLASFRDELQRGGGELLAAERMAASDPSPRELATSVQSALRIGQSLARHRQLQADLNLPLAFQPRRRGDVDFLFVPATSALLRQVRPQLRFQAVADIPTYTLSDAWNGTADEALADLLFVDMPWMARLDDQPSQADLRRLAGDAFGVEVLQSRLFALGHDAWLLAPQLRGTTLSRGPLKGLTGELQIDAEGRVTRSLDWASLNAKGALSRRSTDTALARPEITPTRPETTPTRRE